MDKKKAISIITKAAEQYNENLEDKKILFVYGVPSEIKKQLASKDKMLSGLSYYEVAFHRSNFLHLTGVKVKGSGVRSSINFYEKCLAHRLSETDFEIAKDGTTDQKLDVIEQMMRIKKTVTMISDFTDRGPKLYTEKVAGNVCACIGFVKDKYTNLNVPHTLLKKDIRDVSSKPQQKVYMVMSKNYNDEQYNVIEKLDKDIVFDEAVFTADLQSLIKL